MEVLGSLITISKDYFGEVLVTIVLVIVVLPLDGVVPLTTVVKLSVFELFARFLLLFNSHSLDLLRKSEINRQNL
jgi:hypothetical protein